MDTGAGSNPLDEYRMRALQWKKERLEKIHAEQDRYPHTPATWGPGMRLQFDPTQDRIKQLLLLEEESEKKLEKFRAEQAGFQDMAILAAQDSVIRKIALESYQVQLTLLEQQNRIRLEIARAEQDALIEQGARAEQDAHELPIEGLGEAKTETLM